MVLSEQWGRLHPLLPGRTWVAAAPRPPGRRRLLPVLINAATLAVVATALWWSFDQRPLPATPGGPGMALQLAPAPGAWSALASAEGPGVTPQAPAGAALPSNSQAPI